MATLPNSHLNLAVSTEETYAPKSPDLSGGLDDFEEENVPHPQHQQYRGSISHLSPFTPTEPARSPWGSVSQQGANGLTHSPHHSHSVSQSQQPSQYFQATHYQQPPPHIQQYQQYQQQQYTQSPQQHPQTLQSPQQGTPWLSRQGTYPQTNQQSNSLAGMAKREDDEYSPYPARSKRAATDGQMLKGEEIKSEMESLTDIEVRTKFPVARIKRIMQADEDVGKVAQVTPVIVSKALELFMISLVTKAASQAKAHNSKRVLAAHLKAVVATDPQFDFLGDIVSKVADAPDPNAKKDDDSDDIEGGAATKKKAKGGGKRRKQSEEF